MILRNILGSMTSTYQSIELSVVIPIYNEENNIDPLLTRLIPIASRIGIYEVIFVIDPGTDNSEDLIMKYSEANNCIKYIKMSRRFGQPAATFAGIRFSRGNFVVIMDADLQDPPELILDLYNKAKIGFDVVYAKRNSRIGENFIKKLVAKIGYFVINKLSDVTIPRDTGDFRILSRRFVIELLKLKESHGFLRGLVAFIGFKQTFILFDRVERFMGKGNYNRFFGSLKIGLNGIFGFSTKPLTYMTFVGVFISIISFLTGIWYLAQKFLGIQLTPGLSTTVIILTFLSGVQLLSLGILGQYITRIYDEVKQRPLFIVDTHSNSIEIDKN